MTRLKAQELGKKIGQKQPAPTDDGVSDIINRPPPKPERQSFGAVKNDQLSENLKRLASETPGQTHFTVDPSKWKVATVRGRIRRMNDTLESKGMKDRRIRAFMHGHLLVVTSERVK